METTISSCNTWAGPEKGPGMEGWGGKTMHGN